VVLSNVWLRKFARLDTKSLRKYRALITQKGFFVPLPEHIMVDPKDRDKPDLFLKLFPHPLSRLLMTLLWKAIAAVNLGDGREMSL